jgi:hypothetical protein
MDHDHIDQLKTAADQSIGDPGIKDKIHLWWLYLLLSKAFRKHISFPLQISYENRDQTNFEGVIPMSHPIPNCKLFWS